MTVPVHEDGPSTVQRVTGPADVVPRVDAGELVAIGIDIPIGLPAAGRRPCDAEVRKLIGPRRNSVFPAPPRGVLGAPTYEEVGSRSRALCGKGLSRQAFAILPKIEEVDRLMTPGRQSHVVEVHPELCFTVLAGHPMAHHKRGPEGRAERLDALRTAFPDVDRHAAIRVPGTARDDVLDAFAAAWSARRWALGLGLQVGGELDERGLRMEMIA